MLSWFSLSALAIVVVGTSLLLRHYAMRETSVFTLTLTFVSWLLAFGIIALVPFDVYLTLEKETDAEGRSSMLEAWQVIYWSVFALSWLLIPLLQEFEDSGEFTTCDRIKSGAFQFVKPAVVVLVIGAVFITVISIERNLTKNDLLGLMIALGNLWGLLLIIVMLGYGLVAVPRSLWRAGNLEVKLKHFHFQASQLDENLEELNQHLHELVQMIKIASSSIHAESQLLPIVQMLIAKCPIHIIRESNGLRDSQRAALTKELGDITRRRLISLHSDLRQTTAELNRSQDRWDRLVRETSQLELVIRSMYNPAKVLVEAEKTTVNKLKWMWWTRLQPLLSRLLAVLFCVLSLMVVVGEVTLFRTEPISVLPLLFRRSYGEVWTQVLCCLPLLYLSFCTYFGLFNLRLTGFYGLYGHNLTDPVHLLKSACMFCRLVNPLCLNFVHFIKVKNCELGTVMGDIDLVPILGKDFSTYFPTLVVLFCVLNIGNCYSRFMEWLGIPQFKFSDTDDSLSTIEGEALIKKALLDRDKAKSGSYSPSYLRDSELADFQPGYSPKAKRTPSEIRNSLKRYYSPSP